MALQLSRAEVGRAIEKARRLEARVKHVQEKSKEAIRTAVRTAEVSGAAFVAGAIQGYTYEPGKGAGFELMGVPVDLGLGVVGHLAGFTVLAGDTGDHVHAFADGFLACAASTFGVKAGRRLKTKMAKGGATKGLLDDSDD